MANKITATPRIVPIRLVLTKDEYATLKENAFSKGQSISEHIRRAVFGKDYKQLSKANESK